MVNGLHFNFSGGAAGMLEWMINKARKKYMDLVMNALFAKLSSSDFPECYGNPSQEFITGNAMLWFAFNTPL